MSTLHDLESEAGLLVRVSHAAVLNAEMLSYCASLKGDDVAAMRLDQTARNLRLALAYVEQMRGERKPLILGDAA